jgi:signal transduction histidine kinase
VTTRLEDPDTADRLRTAFARRARTRLDDRRLDESTFAFDGGIQGVIREGDGAHWVFARELPIGLDAMNVASAPTRLRIEHGVAPVEAAAVDPATEVLRRLLTRPDLVELRTAPLPAATKRFVARRLANEAAASVLNRLLALERYVDTVGAPLPLGVHRVGDDELIVVEPGQVLLAPRGSEALGALVTEADGDAVAVVWNDAHPGDLWTGELDDPLAGIYSLRPRWDGGWWRDPDVRAWAIPVGAGLGAFLVVPIALAVVLRRRRRQDEARTRFVTELAHDLRTPLTAIRLHAELLGSRRVTEEDRDASIETLARESMRLGALLDNLLDLSRLDRGARRFELGPVDVAGAAAAAVAGFVAIHPSRTADLTSNGPGDLVARTDATALQRCLANLVDNAAKFTPPGTPIRLGWRRSGRDAIVTVADDGPGIAEAERAHVFRPYERGRSAAVNGTAGTGLGLALVRELVEGTNGSVRLVDEGVSGAAFELRWPIHE